jgi:hypothetical protein
MCVSSFVGSGGRIFDPLEAKDPVSANSVYHHGIARHAVKQDLDDDDDDDDYKQFHP